MKKWLSVLVSLLIVFLALPISAQEITQVTMISPEWEGFTNKDGTGLYNELAIQAFSVSGVSVVREYAPFKRCWLDVKNEKADFYTCETLSKIPELDATLALSEAPMYEGQFHAFFKKSTIDSWEGQQSIEGKKVVWIMGYYSEADLDVNVQVHTVSSGESALAMVVKDRADFYLDDIALIQESIKASPVSIEMNDYQIEEVGFRGYYPVFKMSERGKKVMEIYEKGMEQLYRSGELAKIYEKWGHALPTYYAKYDQ